MKAIFSLERTPSRRNELRKVAVYGFAQNGNLDYVNEFFSQEHDLAKLYGLRKYAIRSFAQWGHVDQAYAVLDQASDSVKLRGLQRAMMAGFAQGVNFTQINQMMLRESDPVNLRGLRQCVVGGFDQGGHIKNDENTLLALLSQLQDLELRKLIIRKAKQSNASLDEVALLTKAEKLHQFMEDAQMNYSEVQAWIQAWSLPETEQILFLQIRPFLREHHALPLEVFLHITSYILAKPNREVEHSFNHHFSIVPYTLFAKRGSESEEAAEKLTRRLAS